MEIRSDEPRLRFYAAGAEQIAVWHWDGDGPPLLFFHATGFHARCWDQVIRAFPGRRALAVDLRGHGRSSKPAPPYRWMSFADDIAAIAAELDAEGALGVGYSMGGHTAVAAALRVPGLFASLLLVDPIICPPEWYGPGKPDVGFIRKRRAVWSSPDEMIERFRTRPPFATWNPRVLHDYCTWGLLPEGDHYILACPPDVEASVYEQCMAPESNLQPVLQELRIPVTVIRAGKQWVRGVFDLSTSPTDPRLAERFPHGRDLMLAARDHYIPMETPELVVEQILRIAAGQAEPPAPPPL